MGWWHWHDKQTNIQPSEPAAETEGRTTTTSTDTASSGIWVFVLCQCLRTSSRWLLRSLHLKSTKSNRVTVALSVRLTRMYSLVRVFLPGDMACSNEWVYVPITFAAASGLFLSVSLLLLLRLLPLILPHNVIHYENGAERIRTPRTCLNVQLCWISIAVAQCSVDVNYFIHFQKLFR